MKLVALMLCLSFLGSAQNNEIKPQPNPGGSGQPYLLGAGDEISIRAASAEEISDHPFRIGTDGRIDLPLIGTVHPGDETVEQFEAELAQKLSKFILSPQVNVTVVRYRNQQITFTGAFKSPGIYNLQGRHTLTEMLAVAGGLDPNASRRLKISRVLSQGSIPVPNVRLEANGAMYVAEIDVTHISNTRNPADDLVLCPLDVLTAVLGDPIYVSGEVNHIGPVNLEDRHSLTVAQLLNMAGGLTKDASQHIKVFRPSPDSDKKTEIDVDLEKVTKGKQADVALLPKDVVVVPRASARVIAQRAAIIASGGAVSIITGLTVMGR